MKGRLTVTLYPKQGCRGRGDSRPVWTKKGKKDNKHKKEEEVDARFCRLSCAHA